MFYYWATVVAFSVSLATVVYGNRLSTWFIFTKEYSEHKGVKDLYPDTKYGKSTPPPQKKRIMMIYLIDILSDFRWYFALTTLIKADYVKRRFLNLWVVGGGGGWCEDEGGGGGGWGGGKTE